MRQKFTIVTGLITESDIENVCFLLNFLLYGCAGLFSYYNILKSSWYAFETHFVPYKIWLDHVNLRVIYLKNAKCNTINISYDSCLETWNMTFAEMHKKDPVKQGCNISNAKFLLIKMNQHFVKNVKHEQ